LTGSENSTQQVCNVHFQPSDEDGRTEEGEEEEGSEMNNILDDLMNGVQELTLPRLSEEDVGIMSQWTWIRCLLRWMMIGVRATAMGQIMMSCNSVRNTDSTKFHEVRCYQCVTVLNVLRFSQPLYEDDTRQIGRSELQTSKYNGWSLAYVTVPNQ
jgi:hypothetical protein